MLFNSFDFFLFFPIVTLLYFLLPHKFRWFHLLVSSCIFYMYFIPIYILILFLTIIIDYIAGIMIENAQNAPRKWYLVMSIVANVGVLAIFKYYNFFVGNINDAFHLTNASNALPLLNIVLPIGLSFHTFQAMSYTIEVYRGKQAPEKNFTIYALYVMYYPQLVAGPIERPQNMIHQFHEFKKYNWDNIKEGLARMAWGFFKKVVIADRISMIVDYAFYNQPSLSSWSLFVAAMFYSFQIYCDFSGYSDIAIGASKVMGINLMENFNEPYKSLNITEFWTRWHISLSTWFRDYVYIPLGGNRLGEKRRKLNVFIVFLLSGLWHGANWTFVIWGALHGILVTLFPGIKKKTYTMNRFMKILFVVVNFILVTLCWVFFRANSIQSAFNYLAGIFNFNKGETKFGLNFAEILVSILFITIMIFRENKIKSFLITNNKKFGLYLSTLIFICYFFGVFGENQFIYFQF